MAKEITPNPPELLTDGHDLEHFDCGVASLNEWLSRRARRNQATGASRTFVISDARHVVAYYALASGAIAVNAATGRFRRNMPEPIPVVVLARLAVDLKWQGYGLGRGMARDAAERVLGAADTIGIRGLVVHAVDDRAKAFYQGLGFDPSPLHPMTLMLTLADLRASL